VTDHDVFVPFGSEHLASTVTLPDGDPRGIVLLMTGLGASRHHRAGMWTRVASRLANHGLASIRFDYVGLGESTGAMGEWPMERVPVAQAEAALRFGCRVAGTRRSIAVGNCIGAWTALMVASANPGCDGVGFLHAPVLPARMEGLTRRVQRSSAGRVIRSHRALRRAAAVATSRRRRPAVDLEGAYARVLSRDRGCVLMLFDEHELTAGDRLRRQLQHLRDGLPPRQADRIDVRAAPPSASGGFDSVAAQELVTEAVVGWATDALG
jgi:hypothetical protein